jgi:hypothetical protein
MDRGEHPARLKGLGRHKTFNVIGEYMELRDPFEGHPLNGVLKAPALCLAKQVCPGEPPRVPQLWVQPGGGRVTAASVRH